MEAKHQAGSSLIEGWGSTHRLAGRLWGWLWFGGKAAGDDVLEWSQWRCAGGGSVYGV